MSRDLVVSGVALACAVALAMAQTSRGAAPATAPATAATTLPPRSDPAEAARIQSSIDAMAQGLLRDTGGDPDRFVRLSFRDGVPTKAVQQVFDKDDLPRLFAIMRDPGQVEYWGKAASLVGMIGGDAASVIELLDYARRPIDWAVLPDERRKTTHVITKAGVVRWLGHIKDAAAEEALVRVLTPEGANELVKNWIDDASLPAWGKDKNQVLGMVRGSAAIGLVLTGKKEHAARVDELYQKVSTLPVKPEDGELYNQVVDAMAIKKLIAVEGRDRYEQLQGGSTMGSALRPYIQEFNKRSSR